MNHGFKKLRRHASYRAKTRFDFGFNRKVYEDAVMCIQNQKQVGDCVPIKHVETQSRSRRLWLITVNGVQVLAAYDRTKKAIATFMPPEFKNIS